MISRRSIAAAAALVGFLILCGLGTWQVFRLGEKETLLTQIAERSHAPPAPLSEVLARAATGADDSFTRVTFDCPGLASAPYVRVYALNDGVTGERLMSACPVDGGGARSILVDRGFIADTAKRLPMIDAGGAAPVHVVGVLRRPDPANAFTPPRRAGQPLWFSRDLRAMAVELLAPAPSAWFVASETASNPDLPALRPLPLPANISNRHLGYIITWYGLALALVGVYAATWVARRRRLGKP